MSYMYIHDYCAYFIFMGSCIQANLITGIYITLD